MAAWSRPYWWGGRAASVWVTVAGRRGVRSGAWRPGVGRIGGRTGRHRSGQRGGPDADGPFHAVAPSRAARADPRGEGASGLVALVGALAGRVRARGRDGASCRDERARPPAVPARSAAVVLGRRGLPLPRESGHRPGGALRGQRGGGGGVDGVRPRGGVVHPAAAG